MKRSCSRERRLRIDRRSLARCRRVPKALSKCLHRCSCGTVLHRDHNAAVHILQRALQAHGRARPLRDANVGHQPVRRLGKMVAEAA